MAKTSASNVIDLGAFREKRAARREEPASSGASVLVPVPVWFCWVPMWALFV